MKYTHELVLRKTIAGKRRLTLKKRAADEVIQNSRLGRILNDFLFHTRNKLAPRENYFLAEHGAFNRKSKNAVVLHLYHTETWEDNFKRKLLLLAKKMEFDLYITMPTHNTPYEQVIRKAFPKANMLVVPNRGRDVLPFIKTAMLLKDKGYKKVLKIHSKKSTHRETSNTAVAGGGDAWLSNTLNALIPEDERILEDLVRTIGQERTGMVGALDYYYPLKMYLGHNRLIIERLIKKIDSAFFAGVISNKIEQFGYFAGTMFWADLDTLHDVLSISKYNFQKEMGQTDGTTAHALERVFCLLPQIKGKAVYGVSGRKLSKLEGNEGIFPKWYYDDVSQGKPPLSIVVPVYADWSSLSKNINSLRKVVGNSEDISVHYVNDCGPEADILEHRINQSISGLTNFYYHRNEHNLGFVRNCNRAALELVSQDDDVLLLNSDTKVTKNFVFEMRKVMYSEPDIGAVTSRSNNATVWSVPMTGRLANHRLASYIMYRIIKRSLPDKYITPTIHGFCVLIRREAIKKFGLFDKIYGKGYGEENDFAMRLRRGKWKCAVANYSYVFHYESRSFGNDVRTKQIERNEQILTERYPEYRQLVQEYWDSIKEPLK